jgi:phosphoribosyl 1,2-cyclic phosphodiesterase
VTWTKVEDHGLADLEQMQIKFWGVRGSVACPGPNTVRYGGNTSCVEVWCGDDLLIFDAGTGLRGLGGSLAATKKPIDAEILCSHTHFDHICGIAFFAPCFSPANHLRFWAGHLPLGHHIRDVLATSLSEPYLPNLMDVISAKLEFVDFASGETISPRQGISVRTAPLNHPGGATGYRLEWNGKSVAYITDTEHRPDALDANVLSLIEGVDLMIYDATYTETEYIVHAGWGHSTWQEAVRLAEKASVKQLALYHHDPSHSDTILDEIAAELEKLDANIVIAHEGMVISL